MRGVEFYPFLEHLTCLINIDVKHVYLTPSLLHLPLIPFHFISFYFILTALLYSNFD